MHVNKEAVVADTSTSTATVAPPDDKELDKLTEPQQMAAKEPIGTVVSDEDIERMKKLREDAEMQLRRQNAKSVKFEKRLERRYAARDPEGVARLTDTIEHERERLIAQEKAFAEAQERAAEWIAPDAVKGRTDKVFLRLQPPVEQRKMTIQIRALGEIDDGFIMVFEDPAQPDDPKLGRVAESERFGTKNRVRAEIDDKGKIKGEVTHLGYKDFGPLRMQPGDYTAVVVDMNDKVLASEDFTILPDWDQDGQSDQVEGVRSPKPVKASKETKSPRQESIDKARKRGQDEALIESSNEEERAAMAEEQVARQKAKAAGEDIPPPPGSGAPDELTAEQKKAQKNTPEARASKG